MRIVILLPKLNAGAELSLNKLLRRGGVQIAGIVRSDISLFRRKYWRYVGYGVRRAGLFYGAVIALMAYLPLIGFAIVGLLIWNRRGKWLSVDALSRKYQIPLHDTEDINSEHSQIVLKSWKPDVLVTINFDQILKRQVLRIPKVAALNVHPGLLPKYRGLWPHFWALYHKEKYTGVTIHHMTEKIDAGRVIAQKKFPIGRIRDKWTLAIKCAHQGTKLLISTLKKIKSGVRLKTIQPLGRPRYFSLPKKSHFEVFYSRGRRLFSLLSLWKQLSRYY